MKRILDTSMSAAHFQNPEALWVTPNPRAAQSRGVAHVSLEYAAGKLLIAARQPTAHHVQAMRLLQEATRHAGFRDAEGSARKIERTVKELFRAGISCEELVESSTLSERTRALLRAAAEYKTRLRRHGVLDPAERLQEAAERCLKQGITKPLAVTGYPRLSVDQQAFINAYAGEGSWLHLPCGDPPLFAENRRTRDGFQAQGWRVQHSEKAADTLGETLAAAFLSEAGSKFEVQNSTLDFLTASGESGNPQFQVQAHVYAGVEDEVRGVLAQVKWLLDQSILPGQIALIAQDEAAYGPLLRSIADEYGVPIRLRYDIPLMQTRLGAWLLTALDAAEQNFPFEETARLLAHPLGRDLKGRPFEADWGRWRRTYPSGLEAWQQEALPAKAGAWPKQGKRGKFLDRLQALLTAFRVRERCSYWAEETVAFYELLNGIDQLGAWPSDTLTRDQFFAELRELFSLLQAPVHPGRGGIELHTPQAVHGARFDHVFVLGAAEGEWPTPAAESLVLDYHDREVAAFQHLENAIDAANREYLSFWALLNTARQSFTMSCPQVMHGKETLPSVYFDTLALTPQPLSWRFIASHEELRRISLRADRVELDEVAQKARRVWEIERRRELEAQYDAHDGVIGGRVDYQNHTFSASQLIQLGQCPFRWFAGYMLRLAEVEEAEPELTPLHRGRLHHKVLQKLLQNTDFTDKPREHWRRQLETVFQEAVDELNQAGVFLARLPNWPAQQKELLQQLCRVIESEDFWQEERTPIKFEEPFAFVWLGLPVKGVIDRIDRSPNGVILMDYKTGSQRPAGVKNQNGEAKWDLQLPLYQEAIEQALLPGQRVSGAYYFSIAKAKKLPQAKDGPDLEQLAQCFQSALEHGRFPVQPDHEYKACRYCDFDALCRKGPRLSRKEDA